MARENGLRLQGSLQTLQLAGEQSVKGEKEMQLSMTQPATLNF